jgi:Ca-activated chloride channel homolog
VNSLLAGVSQLLAVPLGAASLELAEPWALLLLSLPFLAHRFLPPYERPRAAVRVPSCEPLAESMGGKRERRVVVVARGLFKWLLAPLAFALLVAAAARPELVEPPVERIQSARDLLLALDVSNAMDTADLTDAGGRPLSRLDGVKRVLDEFVSRRAGDRIGLLVFADAPHVQIPFSPDPALGRQLLAETRVGLAGPRAMIGDALGLTIELFEVSLARDKVVVLLTAGIDQGSRLSPRQAAEIARSSGIRVHTVAIGDPGAKGGDVLGAATLQDVAEATGGTPFVATSREDLERAVRSLDDIEKADSKAATHRPRRPLYHWPLGAGTLLLVAFYVAAGAPLLVRELRS